MAAKGGKKVCVYAICKNEEQFVDRWMDSMREADEVVVLDTGSEDGTARRLRERGARVTQEAVVPWRFDTARNRSLELVPQDADILVCTDLDEVLLPGWRAALEEAWAGDVKRLRYRYTWSFEEDGSEGVVFWTDKIHANHQFCWVHPVHEVLRYLGGGGYKTGEAPGIMLHHYPDPQKSRAQYFPLLELAVREDPQDDRNMHYLGREYMYHEMWDACIETLKKHLSLPRAVWEDERAASMRYIARAYEGKGELEEARRWLFRAIGEAPHLREPYMDMASLLYRRQEWEGVAFMVGSALRITERPLSYISEPSAWGATPYDLGSIACYWLGQYDRALELLDRARQLKPHDERLARNQDIILEAKKRAEAKGPGPGDAQG